MKFKAWSGSLLFTASLTFACVVSAACSSDKDAAATACPSAAACYRTTLAIDPNAPAVCGAYANVSFFDWQTLPEAGKFDADGCEGTFTDCSLRSTCAANASSPAIAMNLAFKENGFSGSASAKITDDVTCSFTMTGRKVDCSQNAGGQPDAGQDGGESVLDGGGDASPVCSQLGTTACDAYITAWCQHLVQCCTGGSSCSSTCDPSSCSVASCKQYQATHGFNCQEGVYPAVTNACASKTEACVETLPSIACEDLQHGTATRSAACADFFKQFELGG